MYLLGKCIAIFNQWKKVRINSFSLSASHPQNSGTAFEIEYQVLEGGDMDIDFQMTSPSGHLLFNELRSEEGLQEITNAEEGDYKVRILIS